MSDDKWKSTYVEAMERIKALIDQREHILDAYTPIDIERKEMFKQIHHEAAGLRLGLSAMASLADQVQMELNK